VIKDGKVHASGNDWLDSSCGWYSYFRGQCFSALPNARVDKSKLGFVLGKLHLKGKNIQTKSLLIAWVTCNITASPTSSVVL